MQHFIDNFFNVIEIINILNFLANKNISKIINFLNECS